MLGIPGRSRGEGGCGQDVGLEAERPALVGSPGGDLGGAVLQAVVDDEGERRGPQMSQRRGEGERVRSPADRRGEGAVEAGDCPAYGHADRSGGRRRTGHRLRR